ncbi:MAG: amidohydrolase family protein [Gemmatimonadales bacterium]|nr:amidohydrolase family protein [Gemmatimonadales bacterium]
MRAATLLAALLLCQSASPPVRLSAQGVALTGATVHTVSGAKVEGATVLLRNGLVEAVGAGVSVPSGYAVLDVAGKVITPGLVHASAGVGAGVGNDQGSMDAGDQDGEHTAIQGTSDDTKQGDVNPSFSVADGIDPYAVNIPVARMGGITTALVTPGGRFVNGRGAWVSLFGTRLDDVLVRRDGALIVDLSAGARQAGGGSRAGAMQRFKGLLRDALVWEKRRLEYEQNRIRPLAAPGDELEALLPALKGRLPVFVTAKRAADIDGVLRLKREFPALRLILREGDEAWVHAKAIAAAGIPVALNARDDIPSFDGVRPRLDNAALLHAAGVKVIIAGGDPGGERNLRHNAGFAVRAGLPWEAALRAITLEPALAFGLERRGALEKGAVADLVVWSGDPFEFSSAAERVFVRGVEVPMTSRMTELRDRYRRLPPP